MIHFDENHQLFTLHTAHTTYQMKVGRYGYLHHLYYGDRVEGQDFSYLLVPRTRGFSPVSWEAYQDNDRAYSQDLLPMEYSGFGVGDFRESCVDAEQADGSLAADFRYVSHTITRGKPALPGLPAVYAAENEAETLEITLVDRTSGLQAVLQYAVLPEFDTITRSVRLSNTGSGKIILRRALSCCLDFQVPHPMEAVTFYGSHVGERTPQRISLPHGKFRVDSVRGTSSHHQNPFMVLCSPETGEDHGPCYGMMLVYSGNFLAQAEMDQANQVRAVMGIHPQAFARTLAPGAVFQTPEVILTYSGAGFDRMSNQLHRLIRTHLMRGEWRFRRPPVLVNNWEATYFKFDEEKLYEIARQAADLGIEMLVMDDGWFGKRDNDFSGLGDWFVNEQKLKGGLKPLVDRINGLGLEFGIWFEPEMISEDSDLFRAHPDWALQMPGRPNVYGRNQLVLDLSRQEVQDYLFERLSAILNSANITYVKWDMNRSLANVWSANLPPQRQGEVYHRYVLGVYALLERFVTAFPHVLLEGCSGGGGRFDAGMLYYSPQIWCSDNSDAVDRLMIQMGTSFGYPVRAMGSHVSVCPNHQNGRTTPFHTRGAVAMSGAFGYELDLCKLTEEEKAQVRQQIAEYKENSELIHFGSYHRLSLPEAGARYAGWMMVSPDQSRAMVTCVWRYAEANGPMPVIRLRGLDPEADYYIPEKDLTVRGRALETVGLPVERTRGDYVAMIYHLTKV